MIQVGRSREACLLLKFDRAWTFLKREVFIRRLPHGLLGVRYLWPFCNDRRVRLHRNIWWQSGSRWPRLLWLIAQVWLWLRWITWSAIPACRRTVLRLGPIVEAREGISCHVQRLRVLKLALLWAIPPFECYLFRLYRNTDKALDYVYMAETQGYHAWRNNALGCSKASMALIQDKERLTEKLTHLGIPVVRNHAVIAKLSDPTSLANSIETYGRLFCKTKSGNRGLGAFTVWKTSTGMAGRTFTGKPLPDTIAVENAWKTLLKMDTALIQPCLENHSDLDPLAWNEDVITVRFISEWQKAAASVSLKCLCATLEVPAGLNTKGNNFYAILQIDPHTGTLSDPIKPVTPEQTCLDALARIETAVHGINPLPDWKQLSDYSFLAHKAFPDVRAIAWDWVISPSGPVLLEGNTGWGCATPQLWQGGFLMNENSPTVNFF